MGLASQVSEHQGERKTLCSGIRGSVYATLTKIRSEDVMTVNVDQRGVCVCVCVCV